MTAARGLRRRRRASATGIPRGIAKWFAGPHAPMVEGPPRELDEEGRALILRFPHAASRADKRAMGWPVEPVYDVPMLALVFPYRELLPDYWRIWREEHPDAKPP